MLLQKLYVNNIIIYINIISRWCPRHNQTSSSNGNVTFKKAKSSKKKKTRYSSLIVLFFSFISVSLHFVMTLRKAAAQSFSSFSLHFLMPEAFCHPSMQQENCVCCRLQWNVPLAAGKTKHKQKKNSVDMRSNGKKTKKQFKSGWGNWWCKWWS